MSVRSRIEQQERQELENILDAKGNRDTVLPTVNRAIQQGAATSTTRSRADRQASDVAGDSFVRTETRAGLTEAANVTTRVRDRQVIETAQHTIDNPPQPAPDASAAAWAKLYEQEQQWKRDEKQRNQDQIKRNADAQRLEVQQRDERAKILAVDLMLGSASTEEIKSVKAIVNSNYPADRFSPERHWLVLQKLRIAMSGKD